MNTLVEKMLGIIMFLAMFVPFQIGLYNSYMSAWEFTQVTDEFVQLVQEEGGLAGKATEYKNQLANLKNTPYAITVKKGTTNVTGKQAVGTELNISIKRNDKIGMYGWKPELQRDNIKVTVYRR